MSQFGCVILKYAYHHSKNKQLPQQSCTLQRTNISHQTGKGAKSSTQKCRLGGDTWMCFRCFGKSSKKYSPKWWLKMVMNPMVQSVKSHLKQITRICTNMLVPRRTSFFISPNQKSQNQSKSPIPPHLVVIPIVLVHVWLRQPGLPVVLRRHHIVSCPQLLLPPVESRSSR